jgi:hypothetical protein
MGVLAMLSVVSLHQGTTEAGQLSKSGHSASLRPLFATSAGGGVHLGVMSEIDFSPVIRRANGRPSGGAKAFFHTQQMRM